MAKAIVTMISILLEGPFSLKRDKGGTTIEIKVPKGGLEIVEHQEKTIPYGTMSRGHRIVIRSETEWED